MRLLRSLNPALVAIALVALLGAIVIALLPGNRYNTLTAEFPRTVSLYKGSEVKILGVAVGQVESVTPSGTKVIVKMKWDANRAVPADAKAVVISPSIVGDRYVQLTPAWESGPKLADGARLGLDRTATPLELDEIFGSLNNLAKALGPEGANEPDGSGVGPLTRLLDSTARNFGGQGVQFNRTLKNLSKLTSTLANNKDELFGSLQQVEAFTNTLAKNDQTVRRFNDALARGADLLADERDELAAVLQNLGVALTEVRSFVQENRANLTYNIKELHTLTKAIVKNRDQVDETLRVAPLALNNLALLGNFTTRTLDTRMQVTEVADALTNDPAIVLCGLLPDACEPLTGMLEILGLARTGTFGEVAKPVTEVEPIDRSLGGLLEVAK